MSRNSQPKQAEEEKEYQDPGQDVEARAAALISERYEQERSARPKTDALTELLLSNKPVDRYTNDAVNDSGRLIPDLHEIYRDAPNLAKNMGAPVGDMQFDNGEEPSVVRIRKANEPDDMYANRLDPRLWNVFLYLMRETLGKDENGKVVPEAMAAADEAIARFAKHAKGVGLGAQPISMLRQRLWDNLWNRRIKINGEASDRTAADENENTLDNKRLALLLNYTIYDALNDLARQLGYSNKRAFCMAVLYMMHAEIL